MMPRDATPSMPDGMDAPFWMEAEAEPAPPARPARVESAKAFVRAFGRRHSYDLVHNGAALLGFLWGLPVPIFGLALYRLVAEHSSMGWAELIVTHPALILFLVHPFLFSVVFGALGTVRRDLADENRHLIAQLTELAITDPLTEVHNRRYVFEALKWSLARFQRTGEGGAVVLFDLDGFKRVNDERGHMAGDRLLREVAVALKSTLRRSDPLGRYGGDEFLLVMIGRPERAAELVERAQAAVLQRTSIRVSAGVAYWPADGDRMDVLIGVADERLAIDKERARMRSRGILRRVV